jgi:hypothetical protein
VFGFSERFVFKIRHIAYLQNVIGNILPAEEAAPTELRTSRPLAASLHPFAKYSL